MKEFKATIHVGLGDLIYMKAQFDSAKHKFDRIELTFNKGWSGVHDGYYMNFLNELGQLLFSEPPYVITEIDHPHMSAVDIHRDHKILLTKPNLSYLLCKGTPLDIDSEYIVLTTKLRYFNRKKFDELSPKFFNTIERLSHKYKIVVLGERVVEMNAEYKLWGVDEIYSIYDDIIKNAPSDRIVDLTIPALGITSPSIAQIQQDCLIMNLAKMVITLGVGGNFSMATAVANTVGFRIDQDIIADEIFKTSYPNVIVTKSWPKFIEILEGYL